MKKTPFNNYHAQRGASFVDFAGWEMPIRYTSIIEEHQACRQSGGLFDVSHMGRLTFKGRHARRLLERVLTRRVTDMPEKRARYALICNEQGGVLDDVLVYRFESHWMLVVNASNRAKIVAHLESVIQAESFAVQIEDITESTGMVAVQGPKVMEMIGRFSTEVPTLKRYAFCEKNLLVVKMTISRTGYTGEDGVEIILGANMAETAIKLLLKEKGEAAVVTPCGLGARDTLRIEAGMPLYGHELDEQTDPLAAGLGFAVSLDKGTETDGPPVPRFIGQDALEQVASSGPTKTLIGLTFEGKRTPRQGAVVLQGETEVGVVTSGCLSPTLGHPIAMAYVSPEVADAPTLDVNIGSTLLQGSVTALPFYKAPKA